MLNSVLGALSGGQQGGNPLITAVLGMLAGGSGGQSGGIGGLGDLLQRFQQAGMGDQIQSWIGTGQNQPIDANQIEQVFGSDTLGQLAGQAGVDRSQVSGQLADILPQVIDRVTPNGQVPEGGLGDMGSLMGMLGGLLGGGR
ncbi:MAG: YidB family protein [Burkholderiaceae bacterium]